MRVIGKEHQDTYNTSSRLELLDRLFHAAFPVNREHKALLSWQQHFSDVFSPHSRPHS